MNVAFRQAWTLEQFLTWEQQQELREVLEQTSAAALVFARKGTEWISEIVAAAAAILRLPEIGIEIPLTELYDGIDLSAAAAGGVPEATDQTEG